MLLVLKDQPVLRGIRASRDLLVHRVFKGHRGLKVFRGYRVQLARKVHRVSRDPLVLREFKAQQVHKVM